MKNKKGYVKFQSFGTQQEFVIIYVPHVDCLVDGIDNAEVNFNSAWLLQSYANIEQSCFSYQRALQKAAFKTYTCQNGGNMPLHKVYVHLKRY